VFVRTARDLALRAPEIERRLSELIEGFVLCPPPDQAEVELDALCCAFAAAAIETRASSSQRLSQRAIEYLREHYRQDDLTIEKLCKQLHVSASYFSALFKKETRKTFVQYLTELRMDEAAKLLVSTQLTTAQIADTVGVNDPSYFSYSFKKHFGMSPSQARGRKGRT
jgi:two-component system response regulator YesN